MAAAIELIADWRPHPGHRARTGRRSATRSSSGTSSRKHGATAYYGQRTERRARQCARRRVSTSGPESARAVLVDVATGRELATAVHRYAARGHRGASSRRRRSLAPGLGAAGPRRLSRRPGGDGPGGARRRAASIPSDVIGVGHRLHRLHHAPDHRRRHPLCRLPELRAEPHAWVKLWKHHAAQPEADLINELAEARGEPWLGPRTGAGPPRSGSSPSRSRSSTRRPRSMPRADRLIEAADWIVWQLTGVETRNSCTAGLQGPVVQAGWVSRTGLLRRARPAVSPTSSTSRMSRDISGLGRRAGEITAGCRRLDRAATRARPWPSPTSMPTCPCRRCDGGDAGPARRGHGHQHLPSRLGR